MFEKKQCSSVVLHYAFSVDCFLKKMSVFLLLLLHMKVRIFRDHGICFLLMREQGLFQTVVRVVFSALLEN